MSQVEHDSFVPSPVEINRSQLFLASELGKIRAMELGMLPVLKFQMGWQTPEGEDVVIPNVIPRGDGLARYKAFRIHQANMHNMTVLTPLEPIQEEQI